MPSIFLGSCPCPLTLPSVPLPRAPKTPPGLKKREKGGLKSWVVLKGGESEGGGGVFCFPGALRLVDDGWRLWGDWVSEGGKEGGSFVVGLGWVGGWPSLGVMESRDG